MNKPRNASFILGLTTLLLAGQAVAFRCGSQIITKGDTQAEVSKHCGEPVSRTRSFALRHGTYIDGDPTGDRFVDYGQREVVVEDWIMNFGPRKLMRKVTFEDGIVVRIEELGYGYRE